MTALSAALYVDCSADKFFNQLMCFFLIMLRHADRLTSLIKLNVRFTEVQIQCPSLKAGIMKGTICTDQVMNCSGLYRTVCFFNCPLDDLLNCGVS